MKIAVIYHVPYEKLGYIEDWIIMKGHSCSEFYPYNDARLPKTDEFDMLIIMGGSMGVYEEDKFAWLRSERILVSKWIRSGKPVLGICLGSQIIASVLGSRVYPAGDKEIGWFPIQLSQNPEIKSVFPDLPEKITVFHWHGDTYDLPAGSVALAASKATPCQGFLYHRHVLALQFHCEIKPENISLMINHAGDEITEGPFIQSQEALSAGLDNLPGNTRLMNTFLNYLDTLNTLKAPDGNS